jgi:hypothetical protein
LDGFRGDLGHSLARLAGFDLVEVTTVGGCPPRAAWKRIKSREVSTLPNHGQMLRFGKTTLSECPNASTSSHPPMFCIFFSKIG